jgi:hypothetical protein
MLGRPVARHAALTSRSGLGERAPLRRAGVFALLVAAVTTLCAGLDAGVRLSAALFTEARPVGANTIRAAGVFPGTRTTPAFRVTDASSGTGIDASAPLAYAADGLAVTTKAWTTSFETDRYVDVDLNAPLPAGLTAAGVAFTINLAAGAEGQTACLYVDVRRISTGSVLGTFGSPGSPIGCVTGTSVEEVSTSIASVVATTDVLNDLRARVYVQSSGADAVSIDRAVVSGSTPYVAFTLYPVSFTDAADGAPAVTPWNLAGP